MTWRSLVEARTSPSWARAWRNPRSRARASSTAAMVRPAVRWQATGSCAIVAGPSFRELRMPKYEYACKSCGQHLEVAQSFTDEPLTECPNCGGPLRKVFSAPAITFKGSGFYRTDNRSGRGERKAETTSESPSEKGEKADQGDKGEKKAEPAKAESAPGAEASKPKAAEAKSA